MAAVLQTRINACSRPLGIASHTASCHVSRLCRVQFYSVMKSSMSWNDGSRSIRSGFRHASTVSGAGSQEGARKTKGLGPIRIALEGNIAAGKSTYLDILRSEYHVSCVDEPVSKWQNVTSEGGKPMGGNLLDLFYKDPQRWAYTFQTYAFLSRMEAHLEAFKNSDAQVLVMERSIYSDKHIFATNCWKQGLFNELEWSIYCEWQGWILSQFDSRLDGLVYLRARPETCMLRLQKRGRAEESAVPLHYLQELHERHEEWLVRPASAAGEGEGADASNPPVLLLDCDPDFAEDGQRRAVLLQQTRSFLAQLGQAVPEQTQC